MFTRINFLFNNIALNEKLSAGGHVTRIDFLFNNIALKIVVNKSSLVTSPLHKETS